MAEQTKHTPTLPPISVAIGLPNHLGYTSIVITPPLIAYDDDGMFSTEAVAKRLAVCWNSHDELVAAIKTLLGAGICDVCYEDDDCLIDCQCSCHRSIEAAKTQARAALAKAKKA